MLIVEERSVDTAFCTETLIYGMEWNENYNQFKAKLNECRHWEKTESALLSCCMS